MRLLDKDGNEILENPLLDAVDQLFDSLADMTKEERYKAYEHFMYLEPLKYTQDIGDTTYIIRTFFNEDGCGEIIDTVNRLMEKPIDEKETESDQE